MFNTPKFSKKIRKTSLFKRGNNFYKKWLCDKGLKLLKQKNVQVLTIHGLRRSGNHYLINWLGANLEDHRVLLYNNLDLDINFNKNKSILTMNLFKKTKTFLIFSFEDLTPEDTLNYRTALNTQDAKNLNIYRDYLNLLVSRYKNEFLHKDFSEKGIFNHALAEKYKSFSQRLDATEELNVCYNDMVLNQDGIKEQIANFVGFELKYLEYHKGSKIGGTQSTFKTKDYSKQKAVTLERFVPFKDEAFIQSNLNEQMLELLKSKFPSIYDKLDL